MPYTIYYLIAIFLSIIANSNAYTMISNEHIIYGYPGTNGVLLYRKAYSVLYNTNTKVADWVSYHLTADYLNGTNSRKNNFKPDPELSRTQRALPNDYSSSGYDRGHMAPAADMKRSSETMAESFYLANIAPQNPYLNRHGVWRQLEDTVRKKTHQYNDIYIICGSLFTNTALLKTIGKNHIAVPIYFYKIIILRNPHDHNAPELDAIAFIIENKNTAGSLEECITTIDSIEEISGLNFLPELPNEQQTLLESRTRIELLP